MKNEITRKIEDIYYPKVELTRLRNAVRLILLDFRFDPFDPYVYFLKIESNDEKFGPRDHFELPGGGIEENETKIEAIKREAHEEIGAKIGKIDYLGYIDIEYNPLNRIDRQHYYACNVLDILDNDLTEYELKIVSKIVRVKLSKCIEMLDISKQITVGKMIHQRDIKAIERFQEKLKITKISNNISYINEITSPNLSSEVVLIKENEKMYVYDSGNNPSVAFYLGCLGEIYNINLIISHFHKDHMTNIRELSFNKCFVSNFTKKYLKDLNEIEAIEEMEDGKIKIIEVPSSHCKGCVCLVYDNELLFSGDLIYPDEFDDKFGKTYRYYNYYKLKMMKDKLNSINFTKIYCSHNMKAKSKSAIIRYLDEVLKLEKENDEKIILKDK